MKKAKWNDIFNSTQRSGKEWKFLRIAASLGKKTVNGAPMLFYQAYYADCIYLGRTPDAAEAKALYEGYRG